MLLLCCIRFTQVTEMLPRESNQNNVHDLAPSNAQDTNMKDGITAALQGNRIRN